MAVLGRVSRQVCGRARGSAGRRMLPLPSPWGWTGRGRCQSNDQRSTVALAQLKLIYPSPHPRDKGRAGDCRGRHSCCYRRCMRRFASAGATTIDTSRPTRLESSSPSFGILPSHYFIYQMPISLRRVREYFEEILKWSRCILHDAPPSLNVNICRTREASVLDGPQKIWKDLCAVVTVEGGGTSFLRSPEGLCCGATYH